MLAAGDIFFQETEDDLHLLPSLDLRPGELFGIAVIVMIQTGHVYPPGAVNALVQSHLFPGNGIFALFPRFRHLVHKPHGADIFVLRAVGEQFFLVNAVDDKEKTGRLRPAVVIFPHFKWRASVTGNIRVPGAVHNDPGFDGPQAAFAGEHRGSDPAVFHDHSLEHGVIQQCDAGFLAHILRHGLQHLGAEWGDMRVPFVAPGSIAGARIHLGGVDRPVFPDQALYKFLKEAADHLLLHGRVITGHEGTDQSRGRKAAQITVLIA